MYRIQSPKNTVFVSYRLQRWCYCSCEEMSEKNWFARDFQKYAFDYRESRNSTVKKAQFLHLDCNESNKAKHCNMFAEYIDPLNSQSTNQCFLHFFFKKKNKEKRYLHVLIYRITIIRHRHNDSFFFSISLSTCQLLQFHSKLSEWSFFEVCLFLEFMTLAFHWKYFSKKKTLLWFIWCCVGAK